MTNGVNLLPELIIVNISLPPTFTPSGVTLAQKGLTMSIFSRMGPFYTALKLLLGC